MEEKKNCTTESCRVKSNCKCAAAPFFVGLIVALAFGWWVFPDLIFSKQPQPVLFLHSTHVDEMAMQCSECHFLREDGTFSGIPNIDNCSQCHVDILSMEPGPDATKDEIALYESEKTLVEEYIRKDIPIKWKVHQKQPDNVFFSHAAHYESCYKCHLTMKNQYNLGTPDNPEKLCSKCHLSPAELDQKQHVESNVMTDYSKTTMKMVKCEQCHSRPGHYYDFGKGRTTANNACFTCHK